MVIIIFTSALVVGLIYLISSKYVGDSSPLSEPRSTVVSIGIQIICGDCAGEKDPPVKTYLDRFGNCGQCGGHSYILAAHRMIHSQRFRTACLPGYDHALIDHRG